jgi:hypothetical protein
MAPVAMKNQKLADSKKPVKVRPPPPEAKELTAVHLSSMCFPEVTGGRVLVTEAAARAAT